MHREFSGSVMTANGVFIIAEVAQAHDGSLGILHSYIDAVAGTGADAIKFQVHIAEAESSEYEPFRVPFTLVDKSRFDYWKRTGFSREQWAGIKSHCERAGLEFIASPFSVAAAKLLDELGVRSFKVASGEIRNFLMLDYMARTGRELWISTGMSSYAEIQDTLDFLGSIKECGKRVLFQCTTAYPTPPEQVGLNVIAEMKERFGLPIGLSDHSGTVFAPLAAVSLGAEYLESHVVFDRRMFGPDSPASLTIDEFTQMVAGARFIETALCNPVNKHDASKYAELKGMFGKSLAVCRDKAAGTEITLDDLESKKPAGKGIPADEFRSVLGKRLKNGLSAGSFITRNDLS